jgi:nucleoside-diphosphate-sugar epimerase
MKKILIIGGAGYIGSVLCRLILESGYEVTIIDNLKRGMKGIGDILNQAKLLKCDITNDKEIKELSQYLDCDVIINLAAIVGDPECDKDKREATTTNCLGVMNLYNNFCKNKGVKYIQASTCSVYGISEEICHEENKLNPISLYADTKYLDESYLLLKLPNVVILRFATAFGWSPNMRYDLTVNEFVKTLLDHERLEIYDQNTWRPYCHVKDIARAILKCIEKDVSGVYNVGDDRNNYTKKMIADEIAGCKSSIFPNISYINKGNDKRDYIVSFEKIKKELGFEAEYLIKDGIKEICGNYESIKK